jgi:predicted DNA-binding transcriptional regulator AlpA
MTDINRLGRRLRTRQVADLEGVSTRTLYEHVRLKKFPPPDLPAECHGAPSYWYESTLERVRQERQARASAAKTAAA